MTQRPSADRLRQVAVWGLAATAAALPLFVVRWRVGPLPTTLLENVVGATVLAYLAVLWTERRWPQARTPYDIPIALLLLAGVIGIVVAPDHARALGIFRAYFVEAIAIFYIAVDLVRTRRDLRIVLGGLLAGGTWMAVGQIVDFTIVALHHSIQLGAAPSFLSTSSNSVALFLEPPVAFAAGLALFDETRRLRLLVAVTVTVVLAGAVLTLSRGLYGALGLLLLMVIFSLSRWRARFAATAAILVAGVAFLSIPLIRDRIATVQVSILLRDSLYQQAFHVLIQRPLLGAGISGYPVRATPFRPPRQTIELYPHNLWLTTWSELGLLGLIAFAVIFFGLIWRSARALRGSNGVVRAVIWGALASLILYTAHGMVDSPYWKNDLSIEFWFIAALSVVAIRARGGPLTSRAGSASSSGSEVGEVGGSEDTLVDGRLHERLGET